MRTLIKQIKIQDSYVLCAVQVNPCLCLPVRISTQTGAPHRQAGKD